MLRWKSDSLIVLGARESRVHGEAARQIETDFRETLPAHTETGKGVHTTESDSQEGDVRPEGTF
jgi:hypothetical protein